MEPRIIVALGAALAGIGVALGAFGAHGLADMVTPERLKVFETAVRYHLVHALALVLTGFMASSWRSTSTTAVAYLFLAGMVLFSGSLYVLVLTDTSWLGAITPIGGVAWMAGWGLFAWAALSKIK